MIQLTDVKGRVHAIHPDAIARAAAWVLGETDVDTDDPRSDAEIAAAAAAENRSEF